MPKENKRKPKFKKKIGGRKKLLKSLKDDASKFLTSEEGKVVKKDIVKAAIALGLVASATHDASAQHTDSHSDSAHADSIQHHIHNDSNIPKYGHSSGHSDTAHIDSHTNHSNHGNHSQGGWC